MEKGKIKSVLFVCTGNLCRSVMGEGILKDLLQKQGHSGIQVSSAGTWGLDGEPAAPYTIEICSQKGVDVSGHVVRRVTKSMIQENDLVVVMELDHLQHVLELVPSAETKTRMLSEFDPENVNYYASIPDPYGQRKVHYRKCFERIEGLVHVMAQEILKKKKGEREP